MLVRLRIGRPRSVSNRQIVPVVLGVDVAVDVAVLGVDAAIVKT